MKKNYTKKHSTFGKEKNQLNIKKNQISSASFIIKILIIILLMFSIKFELLADEEYEATTITSNATGGNWKNGSTWVGGVVPSSSDYVVIATTGLNSVFTSKSSYCATLTINSGAILTIKRAFTVSGATSISGRINFGSTSTTIRAIKFSGSVTLNSGAIWDETNAGANSVVNNYTIAGNFTNNASTFTVLTGVHTFSGSSKTISGTYSTSIPKVSITGTINNSGTFTVANTLYGSGTLTNGATGVLNIGGTISVTNLAASTSGNTVNYYGGVQTAKGTTYYNLTLSGSGTKIISSVTVNGTLSREGTATVSAVPTYGAAACLQYQGSAAQTTGVEFPATWSGSGGIKIENANGVTLGSAKSIGANPLTIGGTISNSIFNDGGYQLTATGTLNLTSGTYKLGLAASATTFPTFSTINITAGTTVEYAATTTQTIKGISYSNLTISGSGTNSKTADADITVDGILNLSSANASATQGCLSMSTFTLNMGVSATTSGSGDVTGIVKRNHTFDNNVQYSFGSQYTTITFLGIASSNKPTWISCKISIGNAPSWKSAAVKREYTFAKSDIVGTADQIAASFRYLDSELNSNDETKIVHWDDNNGVEEHGKSNNDVTNNWVELYGTAITYLAPTTALDDLKWTLANYAAAKNTWAGSSTDWTAVGNWSSGHAPLSSEEVLIPSGKASYPVLAANVEVKTFEMESGASLTSGTYNITVNGSGAAWSNYGTFSPGTGTVNFTNGVVTNIVSIAGTTDFYNISMSANTYVKFATNSHIKISGAATSSSGCKVDLQSNINTVEYNGASQSIENPVGPSSSGYYNLIINSSGTTTFPTTLDVINDFTLNGGTASAVTTVNISGNVLLSSGTLTANASAINVLGDWTNDGATFTSGTSSVNFNNTSIAQSIKGTASSQTFNNLSVAKSSKTLSCGGSTTTLNTKNLTITSGILDIGTAASLNIGGDLSNNGTFTTSNGTITFNGTSAQAITGANTFNNLTINNSNGVTANASQTVNGVLNLQSANASTTQGCLKMADPYELIMGSNATTSGTGDVTGIVTRNSFIANTPYSFGNQYTTLNMSAGGSLPSSLSAKIELTSSALSWMTNGIKRQYSFVQTGGTSGTLVTINLHYLTDELYGTSNEGDLNVFDRDGSVGEDHGNSNYNTTYKWVSLSNEILTYLAPTISDFTSRYWSLGKSTLSGKTWVGATSTDWTVATNWSGNSVPTATDNVIIPDASTTANDPILPATTTINTLKIQSGGILNGGTGTSLSIQGATSAWDNLEGTNGFNCGTSTIIFTNAAATMSDPTSFYNVTIADGATLNLTTNNTMRIAGVLSLSTTGILNAAGSQNTVEYNGTAQTVVLPNAATTGYYNLILSGSGAKTLPSFPLAIYGNMEINGTATVNAYDNITVLGNLTLSSGTTYNASSFETKVGGNFNNGGTFNAGTGTFTFDGAPAQTISGTTTFNNLTISGAGGVTSSNDLTINGILNLASENPSATKGSLEMTISYTDYPGTLITNYLNSNILNMGATATTIGIGDVTGKVKRATIVANTPYTFGNKYTTLSLSTGTMPTALEVSITIGNTPGTSTPSDDIIRDAINRTYEIVPTGGSGSYVTANFHYLHSELASTLSSYTNTESYLTTMDYDIDINNHGATYSDEHGRANYDYTNNYIGLSGVPISYFIQIPTTHEWRTIFTLRDYSSNYVTWNGSTSSDWNSAANWDLSQGGNSVPTNTSHVVIPDAGTTAYDPVLPSGTTTINTLSIENGGVFTMGNNILVIQNSFSGGWEDQNPLGNDPGTSTVTFTYPNTSLSGTSRFYNMQIADGADVTNQLGSIVQVSNSISKTGSGTGKWYAGVYNSTVEYNGSSQTIFTPDDAYYNLILSGSGTKTLPATNLPIRGNLEINGTAAITHNNGTVSMTGLEGDQYISGNSPSFHNFIMNNTFTGGTVILNTPISVDNVLTLTNNNIITSTGNELNLASAGTVSGGSSASFVDGPMTKLGTSDFTFPIGNITKYARIGIAGATGTGFTAQYFNSPNANSNSTLSGNLTKVSQIEYWDLQPISSGTITSAKLYFDGQSESGITDPTLLRVAHWTGALWEDLGMSAYDVDFVTSSSGPSSFSNYAFTIGTSNNQTNPLPIQLISFASACENSRSKIEWETASESNIDYFIIEKSFDLINFQKLEIVKAAGNSNTLSYYSIFDNSLSNDVVYYRLTQVDLDGNFNILKTIIRTCINKTSINVNPNPFTNNFVVGINSNGKSKAEIKLFSIDGRLVYSKTENLADEANNIVIDASTFAKGFYTLKIYIGNENKVIKIIKN